MKWELMRFCLLETSGQGQCDLSNSDLLLVSVWGIVPLTSLCEGPFIDDPLSHSSCSL